MDVHCSTCGEPWDTYHLWQDAIYDTDLAEAEIESWLSLPTAERLTPHYREAFLAVPWEFGDSILHVRRCPCCEEHAAINAEHDQNMRSICRVFGDDEDAIAAAVEDFGL